MPPATTFSRLPARWLAVRGWAGAVLRLLLAGTWLWAGIEKIGDPAAGVRAVRAYLVLPEWLAKAVGYGLPYLELALAALLLLGLATRLAAVVSAALLVVFLAGMVSAAARGLRIDCGCFGGGGELGAGGQTRYTVEILRDVGLLLLAGFVAWWPRTRFAVDDAIRSSVADVAAPRVGPRRSKAAQERLTALLAERRRRGERRVWLASAGCGVLLLAVAGAGIGIQAARVGGPAGPKPQAVSVQDGVALGKSSAKVVVDVYEDMQCPVCAQFEATTGPLLERYVDAGNVQVHYYVVSFLNSASSTNYSSRAANAAYCGADAGVFAPYHAALFKNQPAEGSAGLSDDQLVSLGQQAGATSAFVSCVHSNKYNDFVNQITDKSNRDGISGTPTVLVNRTQVPNPSPSELQAAISAAS